MGLSLEIKFLKMNNYKQSVFLVGSLQLL